MPSLRARVFLLSWPIVVLAVAVVAVGIDRVSSVELRRIELSRTDGPSAGEMTTLAEQLSPLVAAGDASAAVRLLHRTADRMASPVMFAIIDTAGVVFAATDAGLRPADSAAAPGAPRRWVRRLPASDGRILVTDLQVRGVAIPAPNGRGALGEVTAFPESPAGPGVTAQSTADWLVNLRRTLWRAALAASLVAAAVALLLATPLVRRVRTLSQAAHAIGGGDLSVRLDDTGSDELADVARSFNAMGTALAQSREQQQRMIADVAHELRTPLTNIVGLVEAMQDGLKPVDQRTLASLREEAALLERLVTELQDLQLAESGRLVLGLSCVDANATARDVVAAMQASAGGRTLTGPSPEAGKLPVAADPRRLDQVLRNLLQNAIAATAPLGKISLTVHDERAHVAFVVRDNGRGIAVADLPRVWERFYRVDGARSRAGGGMGLGLSLVKQLTEAMGGRVSASSEEGAGAEFRVVLPRGEQTSAT